jgi:hypothetical protein
MRIWVVALLVLQPVGWFVPPWISTGQPFLAATHASEYNGDLGSDWLKTLLLRGESLQMLPSLGLGVVATVLALWRGRDRMVLGLAAITVGWWFVVIVETWDGYPGLQRFFLPATAMTCVLSGLGLVWLASVVAEVVVDDLGGLITRGAASAGRGLARLRAPIAVLACLAMLAVGWHYATASSSTLPSRWATVKAQEPLAALAVTRIDDLGVAVKRLGGLKNMLPCGDSQLTINHSLQTAFAWEAGTDLENIKTVLTKPGLAFVGPHDSIDGGDPPILFNFTAKPIMQVGQWSIQEVSRAGQPYPACGGH